MPNAFRIFLLCITAVFGLRGAGYGDLPLAFEEVPGHGGYLSRAPEFSLLVSGGTATLAARGSVLPFRLSGANRQAAAHAEALLPGRGNYLLGTDQSRWRTNVAQYARVRVAEILPHVDMVFYGTNRCFEYDLVLHPGADPDRLVLRFGVPGKARVLPDGSLEVRTARGAITQRQPRVVQGGREVNAHYLKLRNGDIRIVLGAYDESRDLVVDPVIGYSTYLGGAVYDSPNAIAVDGAGNAYIAGATSSFNFPVSSGALRTAFPPTGSTVAFVAKLNAAGTALIYATYLGGSGANAGDSAAGIAVDGAGNAYVTGTTGSADFPTTSGALATAFHGATDVFVAKLNPSGNALVYSTFYGGSGVEVGAAIAIDPAGDAFITGSTGSVNLPVSSAALQSALLSRNDAFAAKLNPLGNTLLYSTYLGGAREDGGTAIAIDATGFAYIAGNTASPDFPVSRSTAFQSTVGGSAVGFVAKINPTGTGLAYATFVGGSGGDYPGGIAIDAQGDAYIAGTTFSGDYPTSPGAYTVAVPGAIASGHGFVSKIGPMGANLVFSTFLGGSVADGITGLALDASGNVVLTGFTYSSNFPVSANSLDPAAAFSPAAFVAKLNATGTALPYSTLLGASGATGGQAIALDSSSHAYVTGYTTSETFPVTSGSAQALNGTISGQTETGFVTRVDLGSATACVLSLGSGTIVSGVTGGSLSTTVSVAAGCAWEAISQAPWLTVASFSRGVGPGSVMVTVASNAAGSSPRSGVVNVGGIPFTVSQSAGSCSQPQFSPAAKSFAAAGGSAAVTVTLPPACAFTAVSLSNWISVARGSSGTGAGVVEFTATADTGSSRNGALSIAGTTYNVTQTTSCVYNLTFPNGLAVVPAGGSLSVSLTAGLGCAWTASSNAPWLTIGTPNGTGNGTILLQAAGNATGQPRSADITISH